QVVCADLQAETWPFGPACLSAIVCVHFLNVPLLDGFKYSLATGGHLYIETFGGQGGNFVDLPRAKELYNLLLPDFDFRFYRERRVGPAVSEAVAVKLLAKKP